MTQMRDTVKCHKQLKTVDKEKIGSFGCELGDAAGEYLRETAMKRMILISMWLLLSINQLYSVYAVKPPEIKLGCLGGACYSLFKASVSAADARVNCQRIGGILAVVKERKVFDHLTNVLSLNDQVWIGLSRTDGRSSWIFEDKTPYPYSNFTPFWTERRETIVFVNIRPIPKNCVDLHQKHFREVQCSELKEYLCQINELPCDVNDLLVPNSVFENCLTNKMINGSDQIVIECAPGYAAKGHGDWLHTAEFPSKFNVTCYNGTWREHPHCTPICSLPPADSTKIDIFPKRPSYFVEDNVTFTCQDGYFTSQDYPMSHATIMCRGVNQWEPSTYSLDCVPASKFIFAHKQYEELLMEVELSQTVLLECTGKQHALHSHDLTYVWFRGQHDIQPLEELNYTVISSNGSLLLHSFDVSHEGVYSCYFNNIPGPLAYKIKIRNGCLNTTPNNSVIFNEGSSPKLLCSEYDSLMNVLPPSWSKDGMRLLGNEKFIILPNGALFIPNITLLDNGMYTCEVTQAGGFCPKRYSTQVSVTSAGNTCGLTGNAEATPWLVSLWWEEENSPFCYGARINEQWVVTSAFCLFGVHRKKHPDFFIHIGNTSGITGNISQYLPVESAKIYSFYSRRSNCGDIGLIKLRSALKFWNKDHVKPLCLPETDIGLLKTEHGACELPTALTGIASGWGSLEESFEGNTLKKEELTVDTTGECQLPTCDPSKEDSMFCASGTESLQKQAGGSGSPFHVEWNGQLYLYGIFSWGERASLGGKYDFYTKVSSYTRWIKRHMH